MLNYGSAVVPLAWHNSAEKTRKWRPITTKPIPVQEGKPSFIKKHP
jgi:hypothetical protein